MKVIRFAERNWRPDEGSLVSTGDYRVPEDMPEELAQRALEDGVAVLVVGGEEKPPAKTKKAKEPTAE